MIERKFHIPDLDFRDAVGVDAAATAYADDPRVWLDNDDESMFVYHNGVSRLVRYLPDGTPGWAVLGTDTLEPVFEVDQRLLVGFETRDEAIASQIGDPCVVAGDDGTYTIVPGPGDPPGEWTIIGSDAEGWRALHPDDGFDDDLFASAADAVNAVCSDPATSVYFAAGYAG